MCIHPIEKILLRFGVETLPLLIAVMCHVSFGSDHEAKIHTYPFPIGVEDLEDASNPAPHYISTDFVFAVTSEFVDKAMAEVLANSQDPILVRNAEMVRSLIEDNTERFFDLAKIDLPPGPNGEKVKQSMFSNLRRSLAGDSLETIRIGTLIRVGDLSFCFVQPTQTESDGNRTLCFPWRMGKEKLSIDLNVFGKYPLAQAINRLAIERRNPQSDFSGTVGPPSGRDYTIDFSAPFGSSDPTCKVTLSFNGGFPGAGGIIHNGEMFAQKGIEVGDGRFAKTVEYYKETWELLDAVPEVPDFLQSAELATFLARFGPGSSKNMRHSFAALGTNPENLKVFKTTNISGRRIRFILDADPLKIVFYQMTNNEEYQHLSYDMLLHVGERIVMVNHNFHSVLNALLQWEPFEKEVLKIINAG